MRCDTVKPGLMHYSHNLVELQSSKAIQPPPFKDTQSAAGQNQAQKCRSQYAVCMFHEAQASDLSRLPINDRFTRFE